MQQEEKNQMSKTDLDNWLIEIRLKKEPRHIEYIWDGQ